MNKSKAVHESFHKNTSIQTSIIKRNNFTYKLILDLLDKYLDNSSKKILDIGCGAGTLSFYMANKSNSIYGIDISNSAVSACIKSAKILGLAEKTLFKVMDFPYKIPNGKFDLVVVFEVLEHLKDDDLALKKIFMRLKRGGIVIISTPSKNAPMYKMGLANDFDIRVGHLRRYTLNELTYKIEKSGFELITTKRTEGVIRNFLYLNPIAGKSIRFIKGFLVDLVLFIDYLSMRLFGESDIFIIARKPL